MTITRYAEDFHPEYWRLSGIDFARILPRRCPECENQFGRLDCRNCWDGEQGRGWTYPPAPDWMWEGALGGMTWESYCDTAWRVLGIVDR